MKHTFTLFALILCSILTIAQGPNPVCDDNPAQMVADCSLEGMNGTSCNSCAAQYAGNWTAINGTPDRAFTSCPYTSYHPATHTKGSFTPPGGNGAVGMIAMTSFCCQREYMGTYLNANMIPGEDYEISFYIAMASNNPWDIDQVGFLLTNGFPTAGVHFPTTGCPSGALLSLVPPTVNFNTMLSTTFEKKTVVYTATSNFNFLTIGNFTNDVSTNYVVSRAGGIGAYYWLDEVSVIPSSAMLAVDKLAYINAKEVNGNGLINWKMTTNIETDYFEVYKSQDGYTFSEMERVAGIKDQQHYALEDKALEDGTTYYYIKQFDKAGNGERSKLVSVSKNSIAKREFEVLQSQNGTLTAKFSALQTSNSRLSIYDMRGAEVYNENIEIEVGSNTLELNIPGQIRKGIYAIQIIDAEGTITGKITLN